MCLTSYKLGRQGSRTPWQIIADGLNNGDKEDLLLFSEWCKVSKGKKLIQWSAGLRKKLLHTDIEKTDEELAEEETEGTTEGYISGDIWDELNKRFDGASGELLNIWETTGKTQATAFLTSLGIQTVEKRFIDGLPYICSPATKVSHQTSAEK